MANKQYDTSRRSGESLLHQAKRLAKVADQRLVRLEQMANEEGYQSAQRWAYHSAMLDLEKWNYGRVGDKMRYNRNLPTEKDLSGEHGKAYEQQLQQRIADMENFINAPTSTRAGIMSNFKGRVDTINERYGTNFTWDTLASYFNRGMDDKISKTIKGSKTALRAIGKIQDIARDMKKSGRTKANSNTLAAIRRDLEKNPDIVTNYTDGDEVLGEAIKDILGTEGLTLSRLF